MCVCFNKGAVSDIPHVSTFFFRYVPIFFSEHNLCKYFVFVKMWKTLCSRLNETPVGLFFAFFAHNANRIKLIESNIRFSCRELSNCFTKTANMNKNCGNDTMNSLNHFLLIKTKEGQQKKTFGNRKRIYI